MNTRRALTGAALAATIAFTAKRARSLTTSGALAATAVGTAVYTGLGLPGTAAMLGFFLPASALSKYAKRRRDSNNRIEKPGARDAGQVLANGGMAAVAALFGRYPWGRRAFVAALAAASSDTWSTEIGTTFGGTPYALLDGSGGNNGISGNVSDIGFLGAIGGALCIALIADYCDLADLRTIFCAGISGGIMDSLLGATLQSLRRCTICRELCEIHIHCDKPTEEIRGFSAVSNDLVNALASLSAIIIAEVTVPRGLSKCLTNVE